MFKKQAGGVRNPYQISKYYKKGGCYRKRIVSSLKLERKEVSAY